MAKAEFNDIVKDLEKRNKADKDRFKDLTDQQTIVRSMDMVQNAIIKSIGVLVNTLLEDTLNTRITNQKDFPKSFGTPDALAGAQTIKSAINDLKQAVVGKDIDLSGILTHLEDIHGVLNKLPTEYPSFPEMPTEMAVNNLGEMCDKLDAIGLELQNLKLNPKIEVKSPDVKVDLSKEIKQIEKAVKSISKEVKIPEQKETDLSPLVQAMDNVKTTIQNIQFPVPNFRTQDIVDAISLSLDLQVDDTGTYTYLGNATPGTSTATASWRIKRVVNATGVITHADGVSTFNKEWDERASYSY